MPTQTVPDPNAPRRPMPPPDTEPITHSRCSARFSFLERIKLLLGGEVDVLLVYDFATFTNYGDQRSGAYRWIVEARWPWEAKPENRMFT